MIHSVKLLAVGLMAVALAACVATPREAEEEPEAKAYKQEQSQRELYLALIQGLLDQGKPHAALAHLDEYELKYPGTPVAKMMRADALLASGSPEKAVPIYRSMTEGAYAAQAWAGLGGAAAASEEWKNSARHYYKAVKQSPSDVAVINNFAFALMKMGRFKTAEPWLARALDLAGSDHPDIDNIRHNLILCLHMKGDEARAKAALDKLESSAERQAMANLINDWETNFRR